MVLLESIAGSSPIMYQGKKRAEINYIDYIKVSRLGKKLGLREGINSWALRFECLDDLELLFELEPNSTISVGDEKMNYERFREEYLINVEEISIKPPRKTGTQP